MSVNGWASRGGAELGTNRYLPTSDEALTKLASSITDNRLDGLLMIGGWARLRSGYLAAGPSRRFPRARHPDRLFAGIDQQRPARL